MPVQRVSPDAEGRPGYRWGESGAVYRYHPGDPRGRARARALAARQGRAVLARRADARDPRRPSHRAYRRAAVAYVDALERWILSVIRGAIGAPRADEDHTDPDDITAETDLEEIRRQADAAYSARLEVQRRALLSPGDGGPPAPPSEEEMARILTPASRVSTSSARRELLRAGANPDRLDVRLGLASDAGIPEIDIMPTEYEARRIVSFASEGVDLISKVGADLLDSVDVVLAHAVRDGLRYTQIRDLVEVRTGISTRHAELIARDQIGKLNGKIVQDTQAAAGVESYTWRTANDQRVRGNPAGPYSKSRQDHWGLRGTVHRWDNPPRRAGPYGEAAHPGESIQCRCYAEPILPDDLKRPARGSRDVMRQMGPRGRAQDPDAPLVDVTGATWRDEAGAPLDRAATRRPGGAIPRSVGGHVVEDTTRPTMTTSRIVDAGRRAGAMVSAWVRGSRSKGSSALKIAALDELGGGGIPYSRRSWTYSARDIERTREATRTLYQETQEALRATGADTVTLYRGIRSEYAVEGAIESWTSDLSTARKFAGPGGYVLTEEIPISRVLSYSGGPRWKNGPFGEQFEYMILGRRT